MCRSNPHQGVPTTTVTASHVTQGRVEYESTIPQGTDERLDLWEAGWCLLLLECLNALQTFEILRTIYQMTQCIVLEDLVLE